VLVLDHAGNHHEHGDVTVPVAWSLEDKPKREGAEPLRTCPRCFAVLPVAATVCPECGAECGAAPEAKPPGVENPGELVEFTREDREAFYRQRVREACQHRYTVGWARFRYRDRFGSWPRLRQIERDEYACPGHVYTLKEWGPKRVYRCEQCYDERPFSHAAR
jgi:hypothetical protein